MLLSLGRTFHTPAGQLFWGPLRVNPERSYLMTAHNSVRREAMVSENYKTSDCYYQ
jgi:hypothetical protein